MRAVLEADLSLIKVRPFVIDAADGFGRVAKSKGVREFRRNSGDRIWLM